MGLEPLTIFLGRDIFNIDKSKVSILFSLIK